jgi:predicted metalloprotease with PDZ domain
MLHSFSSALGRPRRSRGALIALVLLVGTPSGLWAQVEVIFADVPAGTLQVRMSRTSPGRYALHEFAKNVYDVRVVDGTGRQVTVDRSNLHQ